VKAEDLRSLDGEELSSRLKGARRELYELRFKHAVGQLDDHRQIRRVRKDIARILTVVHSRRLEGTLDIAPAGLTGMDAVELPAPAEPEAAAEPVAETVEPVRDAEPATGEETPENVEAPPAPQAAEAAAPAARKTRRRAADEEGND
jgi:large subunit ribosomal protein L29